MYEVEIQQSLCKQALETHWYSGKVKMLHSRSITQETLSTSSLSEKHLHTLLTQHLINLDFSHLDLWRLLSLLLLLKHSSHRTSHITHTRGSSSRHLRCQLAHSCSNTMSTEMHSLGLLRSTDIAIESLGLNDRERSSRNRRRSDGEVWMALILRTIFEDVDALSSSPARLFC